MIGIRLTITARCIRRPFTKEFSRDIEPMKGGTRCLYLQTIKNIRQYKGLVGKNYLDQANH